MTIKAVRNKPRIALFSTGGTIVSSGDSATQTTGYSIDDLTIDDLLKAVPGLQRLADLTVTPVANIDSMSMTTCVWGRLLKQLEIALADENVDGVVITHGTDTLEETAYFLDLMLDTDKPVVMTGAMRPATAISADGPMNLYRAVSLAGNPALRGAGVMIALNDTVIEARFATKVDATNVAAFGGGDAGCFAKMAGDRLVQYRPVAPRPRPIDPKRVWRYAHRTGTLPRVDIVYSHVDDDGAFAKMVVALGALGIVHAGTGNGSIHGKALPALQEAAAKGVMVVRASRVPGGATVDGLPVWQDAGFIPSGHLKDRKSVV